jgi:hypothetical protein
VSTTYVIRWKSNVNGLAGRGAKEFHLAAGQHLVAELNSEYPDIEHELIVTPPPRPPESEQQVDSETHHQPAPDDPLHAVSHK